MVDCLLTIGQVEGQVVYEAEIVRGGKVFDIRVSPKGKVLGIEGED